MKLSRSASAHSSSASAESAATTKKVAPNSVSGRVVKTRTGSSRPTIRKSTEAPVERPIQLRCMVRTGPGHTPSRAAMSSSNRSAYSVIRKNHCVRLRLVTSVPHRSQRPWITCSLARTVRSFGHQLTGAALR